MITFNYSSVTIDDLKKTFIIEKKYKKEFFNDWFLKDYKFTNDDNNMLQNLIDEHIDILNYYTELELISKVIAPILNKVKFRIREKNIRDWYEATLNYQDENISIGGRCDFVVAKGDSILTNPYFFIQEFKRDSGGFPQDQLLAEMITAIKLNNNDIIKGAYVMGQSWIFTILQKVKKNSYRYHISKRYDSMDIDDLKEIYKILQNLKQELIDK